MESLLYEKAIANTVNTLRSLTSNFAPYPEKKRYSKDEKLQYEEIVQTIELINGGITQTASGKNELNPLIAQAKEDYNNMKSKEERKIFFTEFEKIESETNFTEALASATDMIYMLDTRLTEARNVKDRLDRKLQQSPQVDENPRRIIAQSHINSSSLQPLGEEQQSACRTVQPPSLTLPNFCGNEEEFPEIWAIFEALVHRSPSLSTIEKMLLLKSSLKRNAESAIKGIQLVPENYGWMIEILKKRYSNKPVNRAKIINQLVALTPADNRAQSCTTVFDRISMFISQMASAGQDVRNSTDAMWTETILSKFPYDIVKQVLSKLRSKGDITIEELMNDIDNEIGGQIIQPISSFQKPAFPRLTAHFRKSFMELRHPTANLCVLRKSWTSLVAM